MAFGTFNILVLAFQLEVGLVVVKIPTLPITGVMAILTIPAQRLLMFVLFLVARPTIRLGILVFDRRVAFIAFGQQVLSSKRESGHSMVKIRFLP